MDKSTILYTEGLTRKFKNGTSTVIALNDVNITVEENKLTILRGRSGSGKTTLINLLGALDYPTEGKVFFCGNEISKYGEAKRDRLRRKKIGFIFQSVALISTMTALENVEFALRIAGYPASKRRARAEQCLELVGLGKRMKHRPSELSGGEQQRVAIARALVNSPRMIVADEPTGNLDPVRSLELMLLLEKINEMGTTVVVVTHEKELVNAFSKRVITIDSGEMTSDSVEGGYFEV